MRNVEYSRLVRLESMHCCVIALNAYPKDKGDRKSKNRYIFIICNSKREDFHSTNHFEGNALHRHKNTIKMQSIWPERNMEIDIKETLA